MFELLGVLRDLKTAFFFSGLLVRGTAFSNVPVFRLLLIGVHLFTNWAARNSQVQVRAPDRFLFKELTYNRLRMSGSTWQAQSQCSRWQGELTLQRLRNTEFKSFRLCR